ncbi:TNFAIP3-interacting protein 2 [Lethenteron reissneri]|uniref:TNFAIP3-interacting protein 2 n=1 Tax=Lethenteron reissneri TaxID=7753 RepID=UPI002AB73659|nr:TNFAIP3-interacting protein 2 [Lethenteron reissneri]
MDDEAEEAAPRPARHHHDHHHHQQGGHHHDHHQQQGGHHHQQQQGGGGGRGGGHETLTLLLHEARTESALAQRRLSRARLELRETQSRLARYEPCRVLSLGGGGGDGGGGDGGGGRGGGGDDDGRWAAAAAGGGEEPLAVFSVRSGRHLVESLALEVARLSSRRLGGGRGGDGGVGGRGGRGGGGVGVDGGRGDGGAGREPHATGLGTDELLDVIMVLERSLSEKDAKWAEALKDGAGEDLPGDGERGDVPAHELRVRLAAATEMCQQLSRRLRQDGPGSTRVRDAVKEEWSGEEDRQQKALQRLAQLEEENEKLRSDLSHEREENVRWRHYEASLQECIQSLQSQVLQLHGQLAAASGEGGGAATSSDPADPRHGGEPAASEASWRRPDHARAVPVEALDSSQWRNPGEARSVCCGDALQRHFDAEELNALRAEVARLKGMLEEILGGQDVEELASLRAFVGSQENKIARLQAELHRKDAAHRELHAMLRKVEVERADERKSSKDYKENIDLLKQQMIIYQEDFRSERNDRERAQASIQKLQEENAKLRQQASSLERMSPRAMEGGGPHRSDRLNPDIEPAERVAGQASPEGATPRPRDEALGWQGARRY